VTAPPDVVVIGGGIVGCSAAVFVAQAGLSVTIVEGAGLASGASGANSGVVQHPFDHALTGLYEETIRLYQELSALDLGFQLGGEPDGLLFVTRNGDAAERLAASVQAAFPDQDATVLVGRELRRLEPALHPALVACRVRMGYAVPPAASTYAYATLAERHRTVIRLGREARLEFAGDRVVGVRVDGVFTPAGAVVVAAGSWTPAIIDPSGRWRPIARRWGVVVETELPSPPRHVLEEAEIDASLAGGAGEAATEAGEEATAAGAAAADGQPGGRVGPRSPAGRRPRPVPVAREFSLTTARGISAVGSTFLPSEPDPAEWVEPLLARGSTFVPGILDAPIRGVRACARPLALDGHPLIGTLPGMAGLYVCAGHGPWGISTGPASARLVADLILGRPVDVPAALDAARFGSPFGR